MTCTPGRLSPSVITSTPQHHKWLQNIWVQSACTMGYYRSAHQNICIKINFSKQIQSGLDSKTNSTTCGLLTVTAHLGDKYLQIMGLCVTNINIRVSVCMCAKWCLGRGSVRKFHGMFLIRAGSGCQGTGKWKPAEAHHRARTTHSHALTALLSTNDNSACSLHKCMFLVCVWLRGRRQRVHFAEWVMENS